MNKSVFTYKWAYGVVAAADLVKCPWPKTVSKKQSVRFVGKLLQTGLIY